MWVLTTTRGQEVLIARLPALIGSAQDADVRLPHESVAARHARVSASGSGGLRLEALDGAVVGVAGRDVERALVHDGDELTFGRVRLVLHDMDAKGTPAVVQPEDSVPEELSSRRRTLQFSRVEARPGLLHADLSQLPLGQRALLWLGVLLVAGGLAYGIALLVGLVK